MSHDRLPEEAHKQFEWLAGMLLRRYSEGSESQSKVTVVLGAGASVWSGLRTWDRAFKDELIDAACSAFSDKSLFVDECWRQLSPTLGLPRSQPNRHRAELAERASIEDIASVALQNLVVGDKIYDLLKKTFTLHATDDADAIQPPQLAYELIAHFLKHGFIDHLITFNFDELLDEAVRNELGRDEFTYVASEHDISTRPPSSLPHLIKLHGTLSRPATLRFTRNATTSLPQATIQLLDRVILGVDDVTSSPAAAERQNYIVSLGYGWRDADMRHWLEARQRLIKGVLIFAMGKDCERLRDTFSVSNNWGEGQVRVLNLDDFCQVPPDRLTVDLLLWALWNHLEKKMKADTTAFMPASRHILLGYLFGPNGNQMGTRLNEHVLRTRFVVEFMLHLAKCKGMVNLSTMANNSRIARYYGAVKARYSTLARKNRSDLLSMVVSTGFLNEYRHGIVWPPPAENRTIHQSDYPDVKETFYAVAPDPATLARPLLNPNGFSVGAADKPEYSEAQQRIVQPAGGNGERFIQEHIRDIFKGPEIEVARRTDHRESWTLRSATPLSTYIDLQKVTREVLGSEWTDLLVIAESGAWLADPAVEKLLTGKPWRRRIFVVTADHPKEDEWPLRSYIDDNLANTWIRYEADENVHVVLVPLSWWQHNRHMTLAFSVTDDQAVSNGGIYFRRRHKASRIQPLRVDSRDSEDVAELVLTFLAYVRRALEERRRRGEPISEREIAHVRRCFEIANVLERPASVDPRISKVLENLNQVLQGA